jgi:non-ribosomal peptide synthetase component E (peptide arylation enzyme)
MTAFVHELISHSVQRSPETVALQIKNDQLSYAQLNEKITPVAPAYASLAITQGDRRGLYLAKNTAVIVNKSWSKLTSLVLMTL